MTTNDKDTKQERNKLLADLRKENREQVEENQAALKDQLSVRKTLRRVLQGEPRSIPDIAQNTGLPAHEVLWHVNAMKKYGEVVEDGMDDDFEYYLYRLAKEAKQ